MKAVREFRIPDFLPEGMKSYKQKILATDHHMDDLNEDFLQRKPLKFLFSILPTTDRLSI